MPKTPRLETLIFFIEERWNRDVESFASSSGPDRATKIYDCLSFLESVLWIAIGNRFDLFSSEPVKRIFHDEHKLIREAVKFAEQSGVISRFPYEFNYVVDSIGRNGAMPWTDNLKQPTKELTSFFLQSMYLNLNLTRHPQARDVALRLSLSNRFEWEIVQQQLEEARSVFALKDLGNPEIQRSAIFASTIFAGVLKLIEFMEGQHQLMATILSDDTTEGLKQAAVLLQGLQRWRLYFRDFEVKKRVDDLAQYMVTQIAKDGDSYLRNHRHELMVYVTARLRPLVEFWASEPESRAAGSGAPA